MSQIDKPCQRRACSGSYICSCENIKSYAFGIELPDFSDVLLDPGLAAHFPISTFHLQIAPVEQPEVLKALALQVLAALEKHILRGLLITGFVILHVGGGMEEPEWILGAGAGAGEPGLSFLFSRASQSQSSPSCAAEILHRPEEQGWDAPMGYCPVPRHIWGQMNTHP